MSDSDVAQTGLESGPKQTAAERLRLVAVTPDLALPRREWLVEGLWPEKAVGFIAGQPKVGKSWLALDLALSLSTGRDFIGHRVLRTGPVLYFMGEDFLPDMVDRADGLLKGAGLTRDDLGGRLRFSDGLTSIESEPGRSDLAEVVRELDPILVIVDPLVRFLSKGDENSASEMRHVTNFIRRDLSREGEVGVCIVHHSNKGGDVLRGTGDFRALSEVTLHMKDPRGSRVPIEIEMRSAQGPEPFSLELATVESGGMAWKRTGGNPPANLRRERLRQMLDAAGPEGLTQMAVQAAFHMRAENVPALLLEVGAIRQGKRGPWVGPTAPVAQPDPVVELSEAA